MAKASIAAAKGPSSNGGTVAVARQLRHRPEVDEHDPTPHVDEHRLQRHVVDVEVVGRADTLRTRERAVESVDPRMVRAPDQRTGAVLALVAQRCRTVPAHVEEATQHRRRDRERTAPAHRRSTKPTTRPRPASRRRRRRTPSRSRRSPFARVDKLCVAVRRRRQRLGLSDSIRIRDRGEVPREETRSRRGGFEAAAHGVADLLVERGACAPRSARRRGRRRRRAARRGSRGARRSSWCRSATSPRYRCHSRSLCA